MPDVDPIRYDSANLDMRNRFQQSTAIVGSPAAAAETIVAQLTLPENVQLDEGVWLSGWIAFTVGTNGTAVRLRIRRGGIGGTVVADTGALTGGVAAAALMAQDVEGVDTASGGGGQQYTMTLQVTGGSAASTVSACTLKAACI